MLRRSFLATSGAIATAQLTGWPALAGQAHIKGAGDVLMRRAFELWNEAGQDAAGVRMDYDAIGSNEGLA